MTKRLIFKRFDKFARTFLALILCVQFGFADGVKSSAELKLNANISSLKLTPNALFIGTDAGEILRLNLSDKSLDTILSLPKIQNYFAQNLGARIFSIDKINDKFLLVSEGDFGSENLQICELNSTKNLSCKAQKSEFTNVKKAFLLSENYALLAYLSAEVRLINLTNFKVEKEHKFSHTSLNNIALDKTLLLVATESGELQVFDLKAWKLLANHNKIYKDTLDQIDLKNGVAMACGKEKLVGIVQNGVQKAAQKPFLTYACALSPSANLGAVAQFQSNTQNTLEILNTTKFTAKNSSDILVDFTIQNTLNLGDFFAKFIIFLDEKSLILAGGNELRFVEFE